MFFFRRSVLFGSYDWVHEAMIDLLLRMFAEKVRFFQLTGQNFGDLRGVMVQDGLAGDQQEHAVRPDALMQSGGRGTQDAFGAVPFHCSADCLGGNDADRRVLCGFVPEAD